MWTLLVWLQLHEAPCVPPNTGFAVHNQNAEFHSIKDPLIFDPDCTATLLLPVSCNTCCWLLFIFPGSILVKVEEQKSPGLVCCFSSFWLFLCQGRSNGSEWWSWVSFPFIFLLSCLASEASCMKGGTSISYTYSSKQSGGNADVGLVAFPPTSISQELGFCPPFYRRAYIALRDTPSWMFLFSFLSLFPSLSTVEPLILSIQNSH